MVGPKSETEATGTEGVEGGCGLGSTGLPPPPPPPQADSAATKKLIEIDRFIFILLIQSTRTHFT